MMCIRRSGTKNDTGIRFVLVKMVVKLCGFLCPKKIHVAVVSTVAAKLGIETCHVSAISMMYVGFGFASLLTL